MQRLIGLEKLVRRIFRLLDLQEIVPGLHP
jgi:hypothetical protein